METIFKKLILIGRPASGKSEFIDFMKRLPDAERGGVFHIGKICELDDFLWLWEKFQEDDLWEKGGRGRLFSKKVDHGYVVTEGSLLDYCFARFNEEIKKQPQDGTIFVEFARGEGDGGYRHALDRLSDEVLRDAAVLFIHTSFEEACRRNNARYQEKRKHTVLAHKVPEEDMERFGKEIDWLSLTNGRPHGKIAVRDWQVPFVTMNNEPELTDTDLLARRYKAALSDLWEESC